MYSPTLQPLLQSLMATLADIDFAYELERERLDRDPRDGALKFRMLQKLKIHHQERRGPYVAQLALLQKRIRDATA